MIISNHPHVQIYMFLKKERPEMEDFVRKQELKEVLKFPIEIILNLEARNLK